MAEPPTKPPTSKIFLVTGRKTNPLTTLEIEAETREQAIAEAVASAAEGEQIEVLQCIEKLPDAEVTPVKTPA